GSVEGGTKVKAVSHTGPPSSEDAGMSSAKPVRTRFAVSLRVPTQGQSASGESSLSRGRQAWAMDNRSTFLDHRVGARWGDKTGTQPGAGRPDAKRRSRWGV